MSAAKLLDRLERVKQTKPDRWIARCPAHEDRCPSLSVRQAENGNVLIYCFAGCSTDDVLAALGMQMADLFETPIAESAPRRGGMPARDVLAALDHEILVCVLILNEVVARRKVNEQQVKRLTQAAARIGAARDIACPARIPAHA